MQFSTVLIANRGEIAVRLIRACARLGIRTVAVYSDADAQACHVRLADSAMYIGPAEARLSYLNGARIIQAAVDAGAEAVHPGYGFLAENAEFAAHCLDAGLAVVGPSPAVISAMGAKIEAKRIAERAGVRVVPGYHGDDQSDATLLREAERIGLPLLIKASAGGGGRGMRRVDSLDGFLDNVMLARQEAEAAFGNATVLLERFVASPRHIEVQILGDKHGNIVHLFERDCSVQRNYQKLIEEAPAPKLDPGLRAEILASAVNLAREIDYDNAGTVEFVVDAAIGEAYFLEMNTRLQVEHPVTEMVTGIDLAEWQLRVAAGQALPFAQSEIACHGSAIEARVAAEDPASAYQSRTGRISIYSEPDMVDLRIDSGVETNSEVTPYYDSMLAKVIAHGADRESAIRLLSAGLSGYRIAGVGVNTAFLLDVLDLEEFRLGEHRTNCLERAFPGGWVAPAITKSDVAVAVLARHLELEHVAGANSPWSTLGAWRLGERSGREGAGVYYARHGGEAIRMVTVRGRAGGYRIEIENENILTIEGAHRGSGYISYDENGQRYRFAVTVDEGEVTLHRPRGNPVFRISFADEVLLDDRTEATSSGNAVFAPTPGLVTEVLVDAGDVVEAGQAVVVLEAMKLLQHICAPVSGVAEVIHYQSGDTVAGGDCLVTIEAAEPGTE